MAGVFLGGVTMKRPYNPSRYVRLMAISTWLANGERVEVSPNKGKHWVLYRDGMARLEELIERGTKFRNGKSVL